MSFRAALWGGALVLLAAGVMALGLWRGPGPLRGGAGDLPLGPVLSVADLYSDTPLRITVFGTSLSGARYDWPEALAQTLEACTGRRVLVHRVTRAGASLDWAEGQVEGVAETVPDLVVMEFAINDADLRDGIALAGAQARTEAVIHALGEGTAGPPAIVVMTMNPARGMRAVMRPRLAGYYAATRAAAARAGVGLLDMEARWRALARGDRGLDTDGLHPDRDRARALIVPALAGLIGAAMDAADCAMIPPD